jgi:hypothetical protein
MWPKEKNRFESPNELSIDAVDTRPLKTRVLSSDLGLAIKARRIYDLTITERHHERGASADER